MLIAFLQHRPICLYCDQSKCLTCTICCPLRLFVCVFSLGQIYVSGIASLWLTQTYVLVLGIWHYQTSSSVSLWCSRGCHEQEAPLLYNEGTPTLIICKVISRQGWHSVRSIAALPGIPPVSSIWVTAGVFIWFNLFLYTTIWVGFFF